MRRQPSCFLIWNLTENYKCYFETKQTPLYKEKLIKGWFVHYLPLPCHYLHQLTAILLTSLIFQFLDNRRTPQVSVATLSDGRWKQNIWCLVWVKSETSDLPLMMTNTRGTCFIVSPCLMKAWIDHSCVKGAPTLLNVASTYHSLAAVSSVNMKGVKNIFELYFSTEWIVQIPEIT